ncbi:unnamed protein product, partial [Meganyctiphanes norvegica]
MYSSISWYQGRSLHHQMLSLVVTFLMLIFFNIGIISGQDDMVEVIQFSPLEDENRVAMISQSHDGELKIPFSSCFWFTPVFQEVIKAPLFRIEYESYNAGILLMNGKINVYTKGLCPTQLSAPLLNSYKWQLLCFVFTKTRMSLHLQGKEYSLEYSNMKKCRPYPSEPSSVITTSFGTPFNTTALEGRIADFHLYSRALQKPEIDQIAKCKRQENYMTKMDLLNENKQSLIIGGVTNTTMNLSQLCNNQKLDVLVVLEFELGSWDESKMHCDILGGRLMNENETVGREADMVPCDQAQVNVLAYIKGMGDNNSCSAISIIGKCEQFNSFIQVQNCNTPANLLACLVPEEENVFLKGQNSSTVFEMTTTHMVKQRKTFMLKDKTGGTLYIEKCKKYFDDEKAVG